MDETPLIKAGTLTGEQHSKKRAIDKSKHHENRVEHRTRLLKIEHDLSSLCNTMRELLPQLRQLNHNSTSAIFNLSQQLTETLATSQYKPPSHSAAQPYLPPRPLLVAGARRPLESLTRLTAAPSVPSLAASSLSPTKHRLHHDHAHRAFPQELSGTQMDMNAPSAETVERETVHCHCGRLHHSEAECIEHVTAAMVSLLTDVFCRSNPPDTLAPRDPSLSDILLHNTAISSPIACILSSIMRQYDVAHIDTLCGIFFLAYRLLRSRFYHSAGSAVDVPAIIRPTNAQITIKHPQYLDLLPFPALRNYLCHNQDNTGHTADLYMRSLKLTLPPGTSLMLKAERGGVELNPEFESFASDLRNWDIGTPWSDVFPQLQYLLR
ncbi:hypothetical protein LMH87_001036 [Akanthomyces muscarius]|uniref:BZIP transcription factor n=1 Tax=Akanthomyces muscarius TaxID=2231603 RepID=A0A9W8QI14_AKAMU|nr:hypothetical protein LMH87_001036 [Akanthomyces muscarius]KAJ4155807.1 hypothetical protein LMH87_001036 [Akanthomyces muscarius]